MLGGVVLAISVVAGACGAGPSGTPDAAGAVRATTPPGQAGTSLHEPVARAVETPTVPGIDDEGGSPSPSQHSSVMASGT